MGKFLKESLDKADSSPASQGKAVKPSWHIITVDSVTYQWAWLPPAKQLPHVHEAQYFSKLKNDETDSSGHWWSQQWKGVWCGHQIIPQYHFMDQGNYLPFSNL